MTKSMLIRELKIMRNGLTSEELLVIELCYDDSITIDEIISIIDAKEYKIAREYYKKEDK